MSNPRGHPSCVDAVPPRGSTWIPITRPGSNLTALAGMKRVASDGCRNVLSVQPWALIATPPVERIAFDKVAS